MYNILWLSRSFRVTWSKSVIEKNAELRSQSSTPCLSVAGQELKKATTIEVSLLCLNSWATDMVEVKVVSKSAKWTLDTTMDLK